MSGAAAVVRTLFSTTMVGMFWIASWCWGLLCAAACSKAYLLRGGIFNAKPPSTSRSSRGPSLLGRFDLVLAGNFWGAAAADSGRREAIGSSGLSAGVHRRGG